MENNKKKMFVLNRSNRLQTIKKKAKELSILCDADVCLLGTHESQPDTWHTWPEDPNELSRVVNKFKKKVQEKEPNKYQDLAKRTIMEFDVDKALEGMSEEELRMVIDRADQVVGDVDTKLDSMLRMQNSGGDVDTKLDLVLRMHNSGTHAKPMVFYVPSNSTMDEDNCHEFHFEGAHTKPIVFDAPSNSTMGEGNCNEFHSKGAQTAPMISDVPLNQTMKEANCAEYSSKVRGPKIFGVYLTPAVESQASSQSPQSTETEI